MRIFDVFVGGVLVGRMGRRPRRPILFRFADDYLQMSHRPVLGQHFEDDLRKSYWGEAQELPPFFANLVPEGQLRQLMEHSLSLPAGDDLALLAAVGHDLPGAVEVKASASSDLSGDNPPMMDTFVTVHPPDNNSQESVFRFSLAGVQMKFSVLLDTDKLRLPYHGELGSWIAKFDSPAFPNLPANEYAIMSWAREAGFEVPDCRLLPSSDLPAPLAAQASSGSQVFLIKRYDRSGLQRIHQEDFAQVAGLRPALKYDHWTYEICARIVQAVCGPSGYDEFIRRLVFMVASGNTDAHLKNWSFLYPDGISAALTPLYDQVAVIAWPPPKGFRTEWALNFAGTKSLAQMRMASFERLAGLSGGNATQVRRLVIETLEILLNSWHTSDIVDLLPFSHAQAMRAHWQFVPLLREYAAQL